MNIFVTPVNVYFSLLQVLGFIIISLIYCTDCKKHTSFNLNPNIVSLVSTKSAIKTPN